MIFHRKPKAYRCPYWHSARTESRSESLVFFHSMPNMELNRVASSTSSVRRYFARRVIGNWLERVGSLGGHRQSAETETGPGTSHSTRKHGGVRVRNAFVSAGCFDSVSGVGHVNRGPRAAAPVLKAVNAHRARTLIGAIDSGRRSRSNGDDETDRRRATAAAAAATADVASAARKINNELVTSETTRSGTAIHTPAV